MKNFGVLLHESALGRKESEEESTLTIYNELKTIAQKVRFKLNAGDTLNTTSLIHEAYLKLAGSQELTVKDRQHFLSLAARAMRQIILNHIKRKATLDDKLKDANEDNNFYVSSDISKKIDQLERALIALKESNEKLVQLVELRFYAGYSIEDTALVMNTSPATVKRHWKFCKAYLSRQLSA